MSQDSPKFPTLIRRFYLAQDILGKKRVPYSVLAERYSVSKRTIKKDVVWIRANFNIDLLQKAIQDKVLDALENVEDPEAILRYCLPFLAKGITQRFEAETYEKIEETIKIDVTEDEDQILSKAAAILARKDKSQPLH